MHLSFTEVPISPTSPWMFEKRQEFDSLALVLKFSRNITCIKPLSQGKDRCDRELRSDILAVMCGETDAKSAYGETRSSFSAGSAGGRKTKVPWRRNKWWWVGQTGLKILTTDSQKLTASKRGKHFSVYIHVCNLHKHVIEWGFVLE
jgi:hypothetical protein